MTIPEPAGKDCGLLPPLSSIWGFSRPSSLSLSIEKALVANTGDQQAEKWIFQPCEGSSGRNKSLPKPLLP